VVAPVVFFVMGYTFLLREQASALQVYLEYCKTIKVRIVWNFNATNINAASTNSTIRMTTKATGNVVSRYGSLRV
jgi:hypothetical protein